MELTPEHLQVAFNAWAAAQDGGGVVIAEPGLYQAAHELAEQGWLERRSEPDGAMSWWWTPAAEGALDVNALLESAVGRQN